MSRARGADFSSWQDTAAVERALAHGLDFAFVKATEGTSYVSPTMPDQLRLLVGRVPVVGLYHFLDAGADGAAQFDHFERSVFESIGHSEPGRLIAVDYEAAGVTDAIARAFIRRGKQRGFRVGLYGSSMIARRRLGQAWTWAAWWSSSPPPFRWQVWQFAAGVAGEPDWNVFNGDRAALIRWAGKVTKAVPKKRPPLRWWLHDSARADVAVGPWRTGTVPARLGSYLAAHHSGGNRSLRLERK